MQTQHNSVHDWSLLSGSNKTTVRQQLPAMASQGIAITEHTLLQFLLIMFLSEVTDLQPGVLNQMLVIRYSGLQAEVLHRATNPSSRENCPKRSLMTIYTPEGG